jgi:hypothetical protein
MLTTPRDLIMIIYITMHFNAIGFYGIRNKRTVRR